MAVLDCIATTQTGQQIKTEEKRFAFIKRDAELQTLTVQIH